MTALDPLVLEVSPRKRKMTSLVLAGVVAAAVLAVSFLPEQDKRRLHSGGRLHSWGHLIVFSVVGYVASRAAHSPLGRFVALGLAALFGFAVELGEHLVYGSALEWKDVLVDALGVVAGALLVAVTLPSDPASREE